MLAESKFERASQHHLLKINKGIMQSDFEQNCHLLEVDRTATGIAIY